MRKSSFKNKWSCLVVALFFSWVTMGQTNSFVVKIDSSRLMIGHQSNLTLTLTTDDIQQTAMPPLADQIIQGVEIVDRGRIDTIHEDKLVRLIQKLKVTSFDSGNYVIPPFKALIATDTVSSNSLRLQVYTFPLDSASVKMLVDIKDIREPDFVWTDYLTVIYSVLLFLLFVIALYLFIKHRKKQKTTHDSFEMEMLLPPHEAALKKLDKIKEEQLWMKGEIKAYYTEVTDVLREYIRRRYEIEAMEMTSSELLQALKEVANDKASLKLLEEIVQLADFVKFAKFTPLQSENDLLISNAYIYIDKTKKEVVEEIQQDVSEQQVNEDTFNQKGVRK